MHTSQYANSALTAQAQRQLATYWRVRIGKTLEQLESEVRRMLRVESSLEQFARDMVARLTPYHDMLQQLPRDVAETLAIPKAPFAWVAQNVGAARAREMKLRYHQLARELHPDAGTNTGTEPPTMAQANAAYAQGDLAALVRLEALALVPADDAPIGACEDFVRQVEQATLTYRQAYSQLLNAPLYSLYARAMSAREDGWDFVDALARRIHHAQGNGALAA